MTCAHALGSIGAPRVEPHLAQRRTRGDTTGRGSTSEAVRRGCRVGTASLPPDDGAESRSSTSDELWSCRRPDPLADAGAFWARFSSVNLRPDHAGPSRLCLYFAPSQVRSPATRAHTHNSPCPLLAPRAGAQHPAGRRGARGAAAIRLQLELLGRPMAAGAPGAGCGPAPPPLPLPARLCPPGSCSAARRGRSRARRRAPRAPAGAGGRICSCCCCRATGVLGRAAARAAARSACVVAPL